MKPPSAGPAMIAACEPIELNASARGSTAGGTSAGASACCAGIWKALTMPSSTETTSSRSRLAQCRWVPTASVAAMPTCANIDSATMRARSNWSTTWPATSTSSKAGRNCSRPTRPRAQALPVRSYICQPMATISIWFAPVLARREYQKRMNAGKLLRGARLTAACHPNSGCARRAARRAWPRSGRWPPRSRGSGAGRAAGVRSPG